MLAIGPAQQFMIFGDPNGLRRVGDKAVRAGIREFPQRRARTGLPPNPDMMAAVVSTRNKTMWTLSPRQERLPHRA